MYKHIKGLNCEMNFQWTEIFCRIDHSFPLAYYVLNRMIYLFKYWWAVKPKMDKELLNVLKLVDMYVNQKNN